MRNQRLYEALKRYCQDSLELLKVNLKKPEELPIGIREKVEVTGPGSFSHSYVTDVEWFRLVFQFEERIKEMGRYREAVIAMEKDEKVSRHLNMLVGTAEWKARVDAESSLRSLLIQVLHQQKGMEFNPDVFDKLYNGIENYFYEDVLEYRLFAPLARFDMESEKIDLGNELSIIKIPKEEKEKILSESRRFGSFLTGSFWSAPECALELYVQTAKVIGENGGDSQRLLPTRVAAGTFDEACSALRLFKRGAVGYDNIRSESLSWGPHGNMATLGSGGAGTFLGPPYMLSRDETKRFLTFWQQFRKGRQPGRRRIDVALRRFNFGYERRRPEDKLIDFLIAFEALLLKRSERQELEYRLALRGANLLGSDSDEKARIFRELKTAYQERSIIVHGGTVRGIVKTNDRKLQFNEFVAELEERLRMAIRKFSVLCESHSESQVIAGLDERIIRGSS